VSLQVLQLLYQSEKLCAAGVLLFQNKTDSATALPVSPA